MIYTNYIIGIVKILEKPKLKILENNILITQFRVQLPQIKNALIISLVFWGNITQDIAKYYKVNDYIIVEGYVSLQNNKILADLIRSQGIQLTVLKTYPLYLTLKHSNKSIVDIL